MKLTSNNKLLLLLDLGLLLGCEDGGQLLLLGRVMLHAAGAEPEVRQVTPDMVSSERGDVNSDESSHGCRATRQI